MCIMVWNISKDPEELEKLNKEIAEYISKLPLWNKSLNRKKEKEYNFRKKIKRKRYYD